ncbi:unnamed protein product [Microthlaspi erraticum]|uniref:Uncharacterized protein n=1 Tax=Microthlaspi erraticum TaxID=1685480 RepID=A0A6D2HVB7_9BRAS|nr:unnamed protein product [Microthlaspi erraticum]
MEQLEDEPLRSYLNRFKARCSTLTRPGRPPIAEPLIQALGNGLRHPAATDPEDLGRNKRKSSSSRPEKSTHKAPRCHHESLPRRDDTLSTMTRPGENGESRED